MLIEFGACIKALKLIVGNTGADHKTGNHDEWTEVNAFHNIKEHSYKLLNRVQSNPLPYILCPKCGWQNFYDDDIARRTSNISLRGNYPEEMSSNISLDCNKCSVPLKVKVIPCLTFKVIEEDKDE